MTGSGVDDVDMCASPFREQTAVGAYLILRHLPAPLASSPHDGRFSTTKGDRSGVRYSDAVRNSDGAVRDRCGARITIAPPALKSLGQRADADVRPTSVHTAPCPAPAGN